MVINSNSSSLFAQRQLGISETDLTKSMEKLSSGFKINRAGDDASGLAVSEKMRAQIRGLNQASKNIQNSVSFVQTTEAYLDETSQVLQRLRELSVQSANGIYSDEDRMYIQVEVSALVDELDRIASHAQFNGMAVLTGRFARDGQQAMTFHIGANMDQRIDMYISTMTAQALGLRSSQDNADKLRIDNSEDANRAIGTVDAALKHLNKQRADLGAYQNRAEMAKKGIDIAAENMSAAESKIRNTDVAEEVVQYTKNMILSQAASAMLATANSNMSRVLDLLK